MNVLVSGGFPRQLIALIGRVVQLSGVLLNPISGKIVMAAASPIAAGRHSVDGNSAVALRQGSIHPIHPLISLHRGIRKVDRGQARRPKLKRKSLPVTVIFQPIRMMLLIPNNAVRKVIHGIWDVDGVIDTLRLIRIIGCPNHIHHSGFRVDVGDVVVKNHLEVDVVGRIRKVLSASLGERLLRLGDRKAADNGQNRVEHRSEHGVPP